MHYHRVCRAHCQPVLLSLTVSTVKVMANQINSSVDKKNKKTNAPKFEVQITVTHSNSTHVSDMLACVSTSIPHQVCVSKFEGLFLSHSSKL